MVSRQSLSDGNQTENQMKHGGDIHRVPFVPVRSLKSREDFTIALKKILTKFEFMCIGG